MVNENSDIYHIKKVLTAGKKSSIVPDAKMYKCLLGLRNPSKVNKINFKEHADSLNKAISVFNEVSKDTSVKLLRLDISTVSLKIISNKNLIGKDDFYFTFLNSIGISLNLLGLKKYSESTNGLLTILDIEEIHSSNVVDDKSNKIDIEELIKKITLLNELTSMGLDEDGSRSEALLYILDTVNNVLL